MKPEMKLIVPQFYEVVRSFDKKVQLKQFEPIGSFSSHKMLIPLEEATPEKIAEVSEILFKRAVDDVEKDIAEKVNDLKMENGEQLMPTATELFEISDYIKRLNGADKKSIESISKEIAENKDKFSKSQLSLLRRLVLHAKGA